MRDAVDVIVERAIVHLINHRKQDLVLSEVELALEDNDKLRDYFTDQVKNALGDSQIGSARFSSDGDQSAIRESYKTLSGGKSFVPSSQELATLLFSAMGTDARIKPASLAVCLYSASSYSGKKFLALIKIDPTEALIEKVETRNGKRVVNFEVRNDVMPTAREKLQKAALIPPKGMDATFDLLLLDRQVAAKAANFFAYTFLNTIPTRDPQESAKSFLVGTQIAHKKLVATPAEAPEHIDLEAADAFQQHIDTALRARTIDLDTWPDTLPLPEPAKVVVRAQIKKKFPQEGRIRVDPQYARDQLLRKRRFRGDYGVLFEVDSDHFKDVVIEKRDFIRNGVNLTRLTIEVPGLQWVR
jgi:37-kD nucleoid-associated bacterial protein